MGTKKIKLSELHKIKKQIIKEESYQKSYLSKLLIKEDVAGTGDVDISEQELLEIMKGYIEAALWTEEERLTDDYDSQNNPDREYDDLTDPEENDLDKLVKVQANMDKKTFSGFLQTDIDIDSRIDAYVDIKKFIKAVGPEAYNEAVSEKGLEQFGIDLWLSRNGHGSGFFDHNYEHEDILQNTARKMKEVDLYLGDDNKLYFS